MATAKLFRVALMDCAAAALKDAPDNTDFRIRCFIASLTGALSEAGEESLAVTLRQVSARGAAGAAALPEGA